MWKYKGILPFLPSTVTTATPPSPYVNASESTLSIGGYPRVNLLPPFIFFGKGDIFGDKGVPSFTPDLRDATCDPDFVLFP